MTGVEFSDLLGDGADGPGASGPDRDSSQIPAPPRNALDRVRVRRRIAEAFAAAPVVELLAGPGWGKTEAAAQYARRVETAVRWAATPAQLIAAADADIDTPTLVVVDDAQGALADPAAAAALIRLVARAEPSLRFLIATTKHAGAALRTALTDGQATVLTENDLRLTAREALDLRRASSRIGDGSELLRLTGGWIAGAALLALGRDEPRAVERLDRYIRAAIIDPLPAEEQSFLRRTAMLPEVTRDDARALLGEEADAHWHSLRRRVLPLVQLADDALVYRAPLREVLVADLSRDDADVVEKLNERHLGHLRLTGRLPEAIEWCVRIGETAKAVDLIEEQILHMPRRWPTRDDIAGWIRLLGASVALSSDAIAATAIRVLHHERRIDEAAALIRRLTSDQRMEAVLAYDPELRSIVLWSLHHRPDDAMGFLPGVGGSYRIEAIGYMVAALGSSTPAEPPLEATWGELSSLVHWGLIWQGRLDEVVDSATESAAAFRDNPNVVLAALWSGRPALAQEAWEQIPPERRDRPQVVFARAAGELAAGRLQSGLDILVAGRANAERTAATTTFDVLAVYFQLRLGNRPAALDLLDAALPAIEQEGRLAIVEWALLVRGLVQLRLDDPAGAIISLERAISSMAPARRLLLLASTRRALAEARLRTGASLPEVADLLEDPATGSGLHTNAGSSFWAEEIAAFTPSLPAPAGAPVAVQAAPVVTPARLYSFGQPTRLDIGSTAHVLRRTKLAELVADFAVHDGVVDRTALQLRLFPEADRRRASNHFRQVSFKLRELLGISLDRPDSESLAWPEHLPLTAVDVDFERRINDLLGGEDRERADLDQVRAAIDLAATVYLPASELPWIIERRNFLGVLYEEAVVFLLRRALPNRQIELIREYGTRATGLNPYAEELYLLMMQAEVAWGSTARARAVYHTASAALGELGVQPSVELRRMAHGLDLRDLPARG